MTPRQDRSLNTDIRKKKTLNILNIIRKTEDTKIICYIMALRSTQPLTEMSTRNLSGDKGQQARKADLTKHM
jgi:hypothetical protein